MIVECLALICIYVVGITWLLCGAPIDHIKRTTDRPWWNPLYEPARETD